MPTSLPPDDDGRWILPQTAEEFLVELELCAVPFDAPTAEARRLLELNGVWAPPTGMTLVRAMKTWRTRAASRVSSLAA